MGGERLKIPIVDRDTCQGHAVCVGIAPDVYQLDEEGISTVIDPEGDDESTIQQAIDGCPVGALSWTNVTAEK